MKDSQNENSLPQKYVVDGKFDYELLAKEDKEISDYLQQKECNIHKIVEKAYFELGREFKEAQDKLAKHGYGCFEEWYTSMGFKKTSVYNYINYYNLIVQDLNNQDLIESLPKELAYRIATPNKKEDVKKKVLEEKVLNGEVKSLKEYEELEKKFKKIEKQFLKEKEEKEKMEADALTKEEETKQAIQKNKELEKLLQLEKNKEPQIKIVEKEKIIHVKDEVEFKKLERQVSIKTKELEALQGKFQSLTNEMENYKKDSLEYNKLKEEIMSMGEQKNILLQEMNDIRELVNIQSTIQAFINDHLAPIKYNPSINYINENDVAKETLKEIVQVVDDWVGEISTLLGEPKIIQSEVINYAKPRKL